MHNALPRRLDDSEKYCMLEYTSTQRRSLNLRAVFPPSEQKPVAYPVPGNPHAMTISTGLVVNADGIATPHIVTEEVPGVLVASEDFVSGFYYGMVAAYEDSDYGEQPFTEQQIIDAYLESAADLVMLQGRDVPVEFSTGHMFGYFHGCTLIGTRAFQQWIEDDCRMTANGKQNIQISDLSYKEAN